MKRRFFTSLTSKEKIDLKKHFVGAFNLPKLLTFDSQDKKIFWKETLLLEEHCIIDSRLYSLYNNTLELNDGKYWFDGITIFDLNELIYSKFKSETSNFKEISNYNFLYFDVNGRVEEFWYSKQNKTRSDVISSALVDDSVLNISPYMEAHRTKEETLLIGIFDCIKVQDSNLIQPAFEPYRHYATSKIPFFINDLFKNWAYRSLVLGTYQKLLTKPTNENLIILSCLNIEIKKINKHDIRSRTS